jgi:hypothetical protein
MNFNCNYDKMVFTKPDICTPMKILSECNMSRNILELYMTQRYTVQMYARLLPILKVVVVVGGCIIYCFAGKLKKIQCLKIGQNPLLTNSHLTSSHDYLPILDETA